MLEPEYNYYPLSIRVPQDPKEPQYNTPAEVLNLSNIIPSANGTIMAGGTMQSPNYSAGNSGWKFDSDGNIEAGSGKFRGEFEIGGAVKTISTVGAIQTTLNDIATAGGGTVWLKAGTYVLTADISIPDGCTLKGVSRDGVIIDCNLLYTIKIAGTNVYSTGTVTINKGATALVGVGTTWTSAMIGRYVWLDEYWYEITAFTNATNITITTYEGSNLAGANYVLSTVNFNTTLSKVTVTNATGSGVIVSYAMEAVLDDLYVYGCGTGIDMDYVIYPRILVTSNSNGVNMNLNYVFGFTTDFSDFSFSTVGAGIIMTNSGNANMYSSSVTFNTGNGISLTGVEAIPFLGLDISGNGASGIEFISNCNDNQITECRIDGNTSDGIKLTATSDRNTIVGVTISNNGGYGINIAAATCDNNQIIAPAFLNNTSGNINDSGTDTVVLPQGDTQIFTTTGANTWTKPASAKSVIITLVGAGGGAGRSSGGGGFGNGGAGGGAITSSSLLADILPPTVTVTIGAGGAGGVSTETGGTGGVTSFGSYLLANGGVGSVCAAVSGIAGGAGGAATSGGIAGGDGGNGVSASNGGGGGGGGAGGSAGGAGSGSTGGAAGAKGTTFTSLGNGGAGGNGGAISNPGANYGGGGSGAGDAASVITGGAGAQGYAIIRTIF